MPQDKKSDWDALVSEIFDTLYDTRDVVAVDLFINLLRQTPAILNWICFALLDENTRKNLQHYLAGKSQPPTHRRGRHLLAWLANPDQAALDEADHAATIGEDYRKRFGGLTRARVIHYIRFYQAGSIGMGAFLTAFAWRHARVNSLPDARLLHIAGKFMHASITYDDPQMIRHLLKASTLFHKHPVGTLSRDSFGYPNWWKLVLFQYILKNPKPRYRIREFQQCLKVNRLFVEDKHLRRFCIKHAITRDMRPGRPRS